MLVTLTWLLAQQLNCRTFVSCNFFFLNFIRQYLHIKLALTKLLLWKIFFFHVLGFVLRLHLLPKTKKERKKVKKKWNTRPNSILSNCAVPVFCQPLNSNSFPGRLIPQRLPIARPRSFSSFHSCIVRVRFCSPPTQTQTSAPGAIC